jgi:hypothetical protein
MESKMGRRNVTEFSHLICTRRVTTSVEGHATLALCHCHTACEHHLVLATETFVGRRSGGIFGFKLGVTCTEFRHNLEGCGECGWTKARPGLGKR